jgi:hypothetical protein
MKHINTSPPQIEATDIDWKAWFNSWGDTRSGHSYTIETLYQAFKARMAAETAPPQQEG